jgi:exosortase/archaeosortase family protein
METKVTIKETKKGTSPRKSAASFIILFVVITLSLLTLYRFAINTRYNDWYLFKATEYTAWVLERIGESAEIQYWGAYKSKNPAEKRATLHAWERGEEEATPESIDNASDAPLSAWERFSYDAMEMRRKNVQRAIGPNINFVYESGTQDKINAANKKLEKLRAESDLPSEERDAEIKMLEASLRSLTAAVAQENSAEDSPQVKDGKRAYLFIVSECGAIEVFVIFFASVIAFPTSFWKRAIGLILGLPILYLVNIGRLSCLYVIRALYSTETFNFVHEYVWQTVYVVFVVALWLAWMEYLVRRKTS